MKELLGFAVLTGPLWLIVLLLAVGIWLGFMVAKRFQTTAAKTAVGIGVVALIIAVPFGDEIAGRIYFNHLCATQAGVKVYHTVELPAEYWDAEGKPRFLKPNGDLDKAVLEDRLSEPAFQTKYASILGVDEYRHEVLDNSSHEKLGEVINFMYWGGWISRNFNPGGPSAVDCERLHGSRFWRDFYSALFKRSTSSKKN